MQLRSSEEEEDEALGKPSHRHTPRHNCRYRQHPPLTIPIERLASLLWKNHCSYFENVAESFFSSVCVPRIFIGSIIVGDGHDINDSNS
jgi:hypothetical protein